MLALYDQIQELRTELSNNPCPIERAAIARELEAVERAHRKEMRDWFVDA